MYPSTTPSNHSQKHNVISYANLPSITAKSDSKAMIQSNMGGERNGKAAKVYALIMDNELTSRKDRYIKVSDNLVMTKLGTTSKGGNYYSFDRVFNPLTGVIQIVPEIAMPIVASALGGLSEMICIYGQHASANSSSSSPTAGGIIAPILKYIVDKLKDGSQAASIIIKVTAVEYYGTNASKIRVFDLLNIGNIQASSNHEKKGHSSINFAKLSERVIGNSIDVEKLLVDIRRATHIHPQSHEQNQAYGHQSIHGHTIYDISICQNHIRGGVQMLQTRSNIFLFDLVCGPSSNMTNPFLNSKNHTYKCVENLFSLETSCNSVMLSQFRDI
ncbi:kinesin, partial [Reticulomyxa filosa]